MGLDAPPVLSANLGAGLVTITNDLGDLFMGIRAAIMSGIGLAVLAALPASAMDAKIYPYHASANYCPSGLQPISIDGVICCGTPNQSMSYQQALAHPHVTRVKKVHYKKSARRIVCPVGEMGCYYE